MTLSMGIILVALLGIAVIAGLVFLIAMIVTSLRSTPKSADSGSVAPSAEQPMHQQHDIDH